MSHSWCACEGRPCCSAAGAAVGGTWVAVTAVVDWAAGEMVEGLAGGCVCRWVGQARRVRRVAPHLSSNHSANLVTRLRAQRLMDAPAHECAWLQKGSLQCRQVMPCRQQAEAGYFPMAMIPWWWRRRWRWRW
jgi:hypothetical protein